LLKCGNEHIVSDDIRWYLSKANQSRGNVAFYIEILNISNPLTVEGVQNRKCTRINAEFPKRA